ncbi:hypothetical protein [Silvimonas iriomotensis]|uniref:Uncharacterized protein n=1 Tax=Silvimonas iriomotensis TaxID=449662 RepID=A0ABQ2PA69_9NEIS|nr:hypothetical protein [Silvimonas iriomotensis]GGP21625.1 hypothetical protein GCM10010970_21410 [Silvimonas iriomotensis]
MGLDIFAYKALHAVKKRSDDDDGDELIAFYKNPDFAGRADDIDESSLYEAQDSVEFRAGSYSWYNWWREQLARIAGYPAVAAPGGQSQAPSHAQGAWNATSGPFWELIHFSDAEGVIGTAISRKLAADFAAFEHKARYWCPTDDWYALYLEWKKAFEYGAANGAVVFC